MARNPTPLVVARFLPLRGDRPPRPRTQPEGGQASGVAVRNAAVDRRLDEGLRYAMVSFWIVRMLPGSEPDASWGIMFVVRRASSDEVPASSIAKADQFEAVGLFPEEEQEIPRFI